MDPTGIILTRQYRFRDPDSGKSEDWGEQLWKHLNALLNFAVPPELRNGDDYDYLKQRLVNYVLARLVVRGVQIDSDTQGLPEDTRLTKWSYAVNDVLDVPDRAREEIAWLLSKICPGLRSKRAALTATQKGRIERFALDNGHRCYICGQQLSYQDLPYPPGSSPDPKGWRNFEIDHVFPQGRGGSRSPANLAACCQSCNKLKGALLSYADIPLENAITSSRSEENVRAAFGKDIKFALLWRQRGTCAVCARPFYELPDEKLYVFRRNPDDAYHFLNVGLACGVCGETNPINGVRIRE